MELLDHLALLFFRVFSAHFSIPETGVHMIVDWFQAYLEQVERSHSEQPVYPEAQGHYFDFEPVLDIPRNLSSYRCGECLTVSSISSDGWLSRAITLLDRFLTWLGLRRD